METRRAAPADAAVTRSTAPGENTRRSRDGKSRDPATAPASKSAMRTLASLLLPVLLASATASGPLEHGVMLPAVHGELLSGREADLPALAHGHVTLVAFGFTRGSSKAVEAFGGRFKAAFGADTTYDWLEVPLMGGMARIAKPLITGAMRGGTPEADRRHVMTAWGVAGDWKPRLEYEDGDWAYLVLLDRDGHVRWRGKGDFSIPLWQDLEASARALRQP